MTPTLKYFNGTILKCTSVLLMFTLLSCGKTTSSSSDSSSSTSTVPTSNESATEIAASSVAGAISSSEGTTGTMSWYQKTSFDLLPNAFATTECPLLFSSLSQCASGSLTMIYSSCQFAKAGGGYHDAIWNGGQTITFTSGSCPGSWIALRTGNFSFIRTFTAKTTRTLKSGAIVTFDTATSSGYNYGVSGGTQVAFTGGKGHRTVTIKGIHYVSTKTYTDTAGASKTATLWDHTVSTSVPLTYDSTTKSLTGTTELQHNLAKYVASSEFNITFDHSVCGCFPKSGTIKTTLSGSKTGTETLTFTGCGTGTFLDSSAKSTTVTLTHCL